MKGWLIGFGFLGSTLALPAAVVIDDFSSGDLAFNSGISTSQEGLDANAVIGGRRTIIASTLGSASIDGRVDATRGIFSFASSDFGYFSVTYTIGLAQRVDLLADGSTAFLLEFAYVDPRFSRGLYGLVVDGTSYSLASELFAIEGPGRIEIPFSAFTKSSTFSPGQIVFSAARVEPGFRIELSSITTVPEPSAALMFLAAGCMMITSRTRGSRQR